jgi:hypothetical protein
MYIIEISVLEKCTLHIAISSSRVLHISERVSLTLFYQGEMSFHMGIS